MAKQRSATKRSKRGSLTVWLRQHRSSFTDTVANFRANRGATLLSVLVIGVTLALPLGLYVLQDNLLIVVEHLGARPQATLFLRNDVSLADAQALANTLRQDKRLGTVRVIDKEEALAEFIQSSNLGGVIATLTHNPLPHTVVVAIRAADFEGLPGRQLEAELAQAKGVAATQFDVAWIRRLHAISDVASITASIFATLLGIGVILITGNTIRVGIHNRRDEIEISKLCGATDAFVRRPFLYSGALGIIGAMVACLIVVSAVGLLGVPVDKLASVYSSRLHLVNLSGISVIAVLAGGAGLGWIGAWISVGVYMREFDVTRRD